jgi:muskelin
VEPSKSLGEDESMHEDTAPESQSKSTSPTPAIGKHEKDILEGPPSPSPDRYKQRSEVFEQLMIFVNTEAKQPEKDLMRLINVDSGGIF